MTESYTRPTLDSGRTILVVDDDPDILASTSLALETEGAVVVASEDGNTAVSLHLASSPDAVVLDMMLPRRSGFRSWRRSGDDSRDPGRDGDREPRPPTSRLRGKPRGVRLPVKPVPMVRLLDTLAELLDGDDSTSSEEG